MRARISYRTAVQWLGIFVIAASAPVTATAGGDLSCVDQVTFEFPADWQLTSVSGGQRSSGIGPRGERVNLKCFGLEANATPEMISHNWNNVIGFAKERMPVLAAKYGTVVRPVSETFLPSGRIQYSSATRLLRDGRQYYFVQYLLGSSHALVYMTFEGYGEYPEPLAISDKIVGTQNWGR